MANLRRSIPQQFCTIPEHLRSIHFPGYVLPCYSLADPILSGPSFAIAIFSIHIDSIALLGKAMPWPLVSIRLGSIRRLSDAILFDSLLFCSAPLLCFFSQNYSAPFRTVQFPGYTRLCDSFALLFFFGRMRVSLSRCSSSGSCSFSLPS